MIFQRIYDDDLAQASFLVGCPRTRQAIVVDPRRDTGVYHQEAERQRLEIVAVTETHIHADYLSGSRQLAAELKVPLHLSAEGGLEWAYRFEHSPLRHGEIIQVGSLSLEALHTPGHTPEHLCFLVKDAEAGDARLLSGDFVFVGDLGRPDLLDEAAGGIDTRYPMARQLFNSLVTRFLTLPDEVTVWPGHGAGSACGKSLGEAESTTVGQERLTSWWSNHLARGDREGFVTELLEGQPAVPHYFARMKRLNREGPELLGKREPLPKLDGAQLARRVPAEVLLIDARSLRGDPERVKGAINVPAAARFANYSSWVIDPDADRRDVVLLASGPAEAESLRERLLRVGIDRVVGFIDSVAGLPTEPAPVLEPERATELEGALILDVRSRGEHESGSIPGALNLPGERVLVEMDNLPGDRPIVVHCQGGTRSAVVASLLRSRGFTDVHELAGGFDAWLRSQAAT